MKARLPAERLCCEEAASCKLLASMVFTGLFSPTARDECCPADSGELLELNRSVKLELQKLWFNCYYSRQFESNDCLIAAALSGSKHTRTIQCCEEHLLPLQQQEALLHEKVSLASVLVVSPYQCTTFVLGHPFSHSNVLTNAFCLAFSCIFSKLL